MKKQVIIFCVRYFFKNFHDNFSFALFSTVFQVYKREHRAVPGNTGFKGNFYVAKNEGNRGDVKFSAYILPERTFYPSLITLNDPEGKQHAVLLSKDFDAFEGTLSHLMTNAKVSEQYLYYP